MVDEFIPIGSGMWKDIQRAANLRVVDPVFAVEGVVFVGPYGRLPVTNMFDIDREPTDDIALSCTIVAMLPNGKWLSTEVWPGELVRTGSL